MHIRYTIPLVFALLFFSLITPACASQRSPGDVPSHCPQSPPAGCRVVIPPCQPPVLLGLGIPRDAASQLGFQSYVATWLPDTVTWYTAQPYVADTSTIQLIPSQPRPLMRIGYAYWFPRLYNAYAPHVVIAFDETTKALGFTTNINVPGQTLAVTSKATVDINGHAATLFELESSVAPGTSEKNATHVIGVEWQEGAVWVRITAVTSGRYFPDYRGEGDDVLAWEGMSNDVLLRVARSARIYTGCKKSTNGAG